MICSFAIVSVLSLLRVSIFVFLSLCSYLCVPVSVCCICVPVSVYCFCVPVSLFLSLFTVSVFLYLCSCLCLLFLCFCIFVPVSVYCFGVCGRHRVCEQLQCNTSVLSCDQRSWAETNVSGRRNHQSERCSAFKHTRGATVGTPEV